MPRDGNPRFPFVEMPINSGPLRARSLVSDRVSWSDTPIFHNTLVVGSSPTSSTTQSPAIGEILLGGGNEALRAEPTRVVGTKV